MKKEITCEQLRVISSAVSLTDATQLGEYDLLDHLDTLAHQVSQSIYDYNSEYPNEMLPKDPETVRQQFLDGNSVMIVGRTVHGKPLVLYHGSLYRAFGRGEREKIGIQVVECGSWIVHPDYRGCELGSRGAKLQVEAAKRRWERVICLATNKQIVAARAANKAGLVPISFWEHPYLSFLTCTCPNCSEAYGYASCRYRRDRNQSTRIELVQILDQTTSIGPMACTLVLTEPQLAAEFETRCRQLQYESGIEPLVPGVINPHTMHQAREFFESLREGGFND